MALYREIKLEQHERMALYREIKLEQHEQLEPQALNHELLRRGDHEEILLDGQQHEQHDELEQQDEQEQQHEQHEELELRHEQEQQHDEGEQQDERRDVDEGQVLGQDGRDGEER